ncbi:hypothetical protein K9M06_04700 [Candidatus Bipolaricaulota bacterium]|nr:hypothetical protein [Candidatus Bipolaricaulota bacterium]
MEKDESLVEIALDLVLDQLENQSCPESEEDWFCQETLDISGQLVEGRVPLVLEVLCEEGHLERKVSMGLPHYRVKQ